jgi:uncharacterized protein YndB with AHSA1/START domain
MTERSVAHGTFVIEKNYPHPVAKVFRAWADPAIKATWFGGGGPGDKRSMDFRVGGRESSEGQMPDGHTVNFDVIYQDIVPDNRILYSYDMHMDGKRISVSLAAIEFSAASGGTHLRITEYGLFLDGLDNMEQRRKGTEWLIGALGTALDKKEA